MAFTMHSHSGEFCPGHAKDKLENIILHAIAVGYKTMGLTEHMPRYEEQDLYPEEVDGDPQSSIARCIQLHRDYFVAARRLQAEYAHKIHILVAFEAEFIRPAYAAKVRQINEAAAADYFIGSVHHTHSIPIDYDVAFYQKALEASDRHGQPGTEEWLWEDYYDLHHEMLRELKPKVVGHFDLIRLMSQNPDQDPRERETVWGKILRNLALVREQEGWLECNTAALRKGLKEPYPGRAIAEAWIKMGGKFTMSDDSHGIAQVATNYARALTYLEGLGVKEVWTLRRDAQPDSEGAQPANLTEVSVSLEAFRASFPHDRTLA